MGSPDRPRPLEYRLAVYRVPLFKHEAGLVRYGQGDISRDVRLSVGAGGARARDAREAKRELARSGGEPPHPVENEAGPIEEGVLHARSRGFPETGRGTRPEVPGSGRSRPGVQYREKGMGEAPLDRSEERRV